MRQREKEETKKRGRTGDDTVRVRIAWTRWLRDKRFGTMNGSHWKKITEREYLSAGQPRYLRKKKTDRQTDSQTSGDEITGEKIAI